MSSLSRDKNMATKYSQYIRKRGYLLVNPTNAFLNAPAWGQAMFQKALFEFNRLSSVNKLGVFMLPADPKLVHIFHADVTIDAHMGTGTYRDIGGNEKTIPLPAERDTYQGFTVPVDGGGSKLDPGVFRYRSYVFMYSLPNVSGTEVGPGVRLTVLLHELIHACGLEGSDPNHGINGHMPDPPHDLFCTGGFFQSVTGDQTHEKDYISWGTARSPGKNGEFTLSGRTIGLIQKTWLP